MRNNAWNNIISNIYNKESLLWNKKIPIFLSCLLVSFIFWLLIILSKNYTMVVKFKVKYLNLPTEKVLVNKLPNDFLVELNATGFYLLSLKWNQKQDTIFLHTENLKPIIATEYDKDFYILPNSQLKELSTKLSANAKILRIYPDTLFFYFDKKKTKILPVKLNASFSFEKQYEMSGPIVLTPSQIVVKGPESILNKIDFLYTETLHFSNLNKTQRVFASLALNSELDNLEFSVKKIIVNIPVEKYTESTVEVPIEVVTTDNSIGVKTFPERVSITYLVALSQFNKIKPNQFKVEAIYEDNSSSKLKIKITKIPDYVKNPKLEFQKVEYILIKK